MSMRSDNLPTLVLAGDRRVRQRAAEALAARGLPVCSSPAAAAALRELEQRSYGAMLVDLPAHGAAGRRFLQQVRRLDPELPVILLLPERDFEAALAALRQGVFDLLVAPLDEERLLGTVCRAHDLQRRTIRRRRHVARLELELAVKARSTEKNASELIDCLIAAAGHRDDETGGHIRRIGRFSRLLAVRLGLGDAYSRDLGRAAALHDLGKIGISDRILLKPGPFSAEESEIMKAHTTIGHDILAPSSQPLLKLAASIALHHHERWDGSGYPHGLQGEAIPVEARIVMLADHYDALRSLRPYKRSLGHAEAVAVITSGDQRTRPEHFDPEILAAFAASSREFAAIYAGAPDRNLRVAVNAD